MSNTPLVRDTSVPYDKELRTQVASITSKYGAHCAKHGTGYFEHLEADNKVIDELVALILRAQIAELSHVQLEYGHWTVCTYADSKEQTLTDRIAALQQQLKEVERKDK